jgi:hypothetical protein
MTQQWLPPLVLFQDSGGDWDRYVQLLYEWFSADFLQSKPPWPGKRVQLKRYPISQGKEATFWHMVSTGDNEADRIPDFRRCERIRWPRPFMEAFPARKPEPADVIVWWKSERRGESRYLLAPPDFTYLVVVADRGEYVLPWTHFVIDQPHRQNKLRKECAEYWATNKAGAAP